MSWRCFWVEDAGTADIELRRFTFSSKQTTPCPDRMGHTASSAVVERMAQRRDENGYLKVVPVEEYRNGPWPTTCEHCSYVFTDDDEWQVNQRPVYRRPDTGEEWNERDLPIGAMFDAFWHPHKGPDGMALAVILPPDGGMYSTWSPDGPSVSGGAWSRTGDPKAIPPTVDVNPSIAAPGYHGYLRNGELTDPV